MIPAVVFVPLLVAFISLTVARRDVRRLRRVADGELRRPSTLYLHSGLVACRSKQLTSPRHRAALARSVARTVKHLSPNRLPGATPLNRVAVRPYADLLLFIAEKLRVSQPTASEHLRVLTEAGLIRAKKIRQWTFYKRDEKQIAALKKDLARW